VKAIVQYAYGSPDALNFEDVDEPVPQDNEVLVRVHASSVNPYDWHLMRGKPYLVRAQIGLLRPKHAIPGADMAGRIEEVGKGVTEFRTGDEVFGDIGAGAFAEYVCVRSDRLALKPSIVSFEQAAAVPLAGLTALQGLRDKGRLQSGDKMLVNGASGGVGTSAVQIAKSFGAHVTAVTSTKNVDLVMSIGADDVVDYTKENFTAGAQRYDVILDTIGNHALSQVKRAMESDGTFVAVGKSDMGNWVGPLSFLVSLVITSGVGSHKMVPVLAKANQADLQVLAGLLEVGKITPVIDRQYVLADVSEAIRYLELGHASGKVVITV